MIYGQRSSVSDLSFSVNDSTAALAVWVRYDRIILGVHNLGTTLHDPARWKDSHYPFLVLSPQCSFTSTGSTPPKLWTQPSQSDHLSRGSLLPLWLHMLLDN